MSTYLPSMLNLVLLHGLLEKLRVSLWHRGKVFASRLKVLSSSTVWCNLDIFSEIPV
uniref:Uncharacterized protein n=1 Tax=Arion vulgaris TaxID=1028688 RepID=A0A0B7B1V4_9EUPU